MKYFEQNKTKEKVIKKDSSSQIENFDSSLHSVNFPRFDEVYLVLRYDD